MLEYRTERVTPDQVDRFSMLMQRFGWKLEQSQEVYNENTSVVGQSTYLAGNQSVLGGYNDVHWETQNHTQTNTTHYVALRFSRNTGMKNYHEICELEQQYNELNRQLTYLEKDSDKFHLSDLPWYAGFLLGVFTVISFLSLIVIWLFFYSETNMIWGGCICGGSLLLTIVLFVIDRKMPSSHIDHYCNRRDEINNQMAQVLQKAAALASRR